MANYIDAIGGSHGPCQTILSQVFADFDLFVMLTIFSDDKMSRSSDFSDHNDDRQN